MTNPSSTTRSSMFYQVELSFIAWSSVLLSEIRAAGEGLYREVCDQLDRASLSSLLNTAEGNGKRQGKHRAKFSMTRAVQP